MNHRGEASHHRRRHGRAHSKSSNKSFDLFQGNISLIALSLSYVPIGTMIQLRSVSKEWNRALTNELLNLEQLIVCSTSSATPQPFVDAISLVHLLKLCPNVKAVSLDCVCISEEVIAVLASLELLHFSLGAIKFVGTICNWKSHTDEEAKELYSDLDIKLADSYDIQYFLTMCGSHASSLVLDVGFGILPESMFPILPHLEYFGVRNLPGAKGDVFMLSPNSRFAGSVSLQDCVEAWYDEDEDGNRCAQPFWRVLLTMVNNGVVLSTSDTTTEALLLTNMKGHIICGNAAWERLTGYVTSEVQGLHWSFMRCPLTDRSTLHGVEDCMRGRISTAPWAAIADHEYDPFEGTTCFRYNSTLTNQTMFGFMAHICVLPCVAIHKGQSEITFNSLEDEEEWFNLLSEAFESVGSTDVESENMGKGFGKLKASELQSRLPYSSKPAMRITLTSTTSRSSGREHGLDDDLMSENKALPAQRYHLVRFGPLSEPFQLASCNV